MPKWGHLKHFSPSEFDSKDAPGSGGENMNMHFVRMLDTARGLAGVPFKITSGYRTPEWNKKVGGVKNSAHTRGYAADIAFGDPKVAFKIVAALYYVGIRRFGIYLDKGFIHVDIDPDKPSPAWW